MKAAFAFLEGIAFKAPGSLLASNETNCKSTFRGKSPMGLSLYPMRFLRDFITSFIVCLMLKNLPKERESIFQKWLLLGLLFGF